jgi:hypothetical protein
MNIIERNGRRYEYDADFDVYRPVALDEPAGVRWLWLVLVVVLAVACVFLEYRPGLV